MDLSGKNYQLSPDPYYVGTQVPKVLIFHADLCFKFLHLL